MQRPSCWRALRTVGKLGDHHATTCTATSHPLTEALRNQLQKSLGDAYRLEHELGGGGMSLVFLAEDVRLQRSVVVKLLSPDLAQGLSVDRFEREIKTVASLQQANIVPILTAGEMDGVPFYTMPFVDGESLRARLAHGPLAIADIVSIVKDVAKALAFAHQRGVVHRDIKPDNVLLSGGTAVVTDFGIAKAISAARTGSGGETLTQIGTSIGTPAYMAPEQAAGDPTVDHRADIYALAAMTYELLSGRPVFPDRSPQRMLAAHMAETPRAIAELRTDVPAPLAELVMRSLAKSADERPQSATDVVRVLETIATGSAAPAMPAVLIAGPEVFRKALAIYAVAFVVVALLARAAIVGIGLPGWVFPGSLIVMALGLPVVLWTGYVQRVTRRALTSTPTYTPGGTPMSTHGTIANIALKAAPHVSWYRAARGGVYAVGAFIAIIAAFMALRALGIGPFGSLLASGQLNRRDALLLTDFKTTNVDSSLGRVVSDAVRAGLSGSSAFTLVPPAAIVAALQRAKHPPDARVDLAIARDIAQREGLKAIVDGEVTGVPGGYIVAIRLVRADSGIELASFRETGDGPKGLIDAADKVSRALRGRAGESLKSVNATPALYKATTSSLDALRKYSEAARYNIRGDDRSIGFAREAVAIDSTFASAWSILGALLSNYGYSRSSIDSALTKAYQYRDRLPNVERSTVTARYFALGPGRDRAKAIAAYEEIINGGDSVMAIMVNLAEQLRRRREFARAESLNAAAARIDPRSGTPLGNMIEMQINEGKFADAETTVARLKSVAPFYGVVSQVSLDYARQDMRAVRATTDSALRAGGDARRRLGIPAAKAIALQDGRLRDYERFRTEERIAGPMQDVLAARDVFLEMVVRGPTPSEVARMDSAIAHLPFKDLPLIDRPYLEAAKALAYTGDAAKARAMLARFHTEMTDTSIVREQQADVHNTLGEIALAAGKPGDALAEFHLGDVGYDGRPADECVPCLPFNLARAFDAAGKSDSAIVMFERYLSTPFWAKQSEELDPIRVPAIHERLGQLYESTGNTAKAAENYRAFIDLWKDADPELQPRVADARRRLARLTPVEKPRPE